MRHDIAKISLGFFVLTLAACSSTPEHTNTLMFGTTTKFALDVSVSPLNGSPDLTVGYKRNEGVWMPLLANQATSNNTKQPGPCTDPNCKFTGVDNQGNKTDTYSVLASFGATFGGGSEAGSNARVNAKGGLAQFFATGIAAQNLATSGGARLVSVQSPDAEATALAIENANASKAKADEATNRLKSILGQKGYDEAVEKGSSTANLLKAKNGVIVAAVINTDGTFNQTKWEEIVEVSTLNDAQKKQLKEYKNLGQVSSFLSGQAAITEPSIINALHSKL
ncbi:hypothetical protein [Undibacterium sp. Ji22W]|uniref:hypothetical protein n=1 Tax=Undibacterium sp. Ji22W TaxID=3413038 RepID=UPI003BF0D85F